MVPRRLIGAALALFCCVAHRAAAAEAGAAAPAVVELRDGTAGVQLGPSCLVYEQRPGAAPPPSLGFKPDPALFRPARGSSALDLGYTRSALWLCFTVRSVASARSWLLSVGPQDLDAATLYLVSADGSAEVQSAGLAELGGRDRKVSSEFVFRLTLAPGEVRTAYLRLASEGRLRPVARLWDSFAYVRAGEADAAFEGSLLGIIAAVFVYTLVLVVSLRDRSYGFYLVYLGGLLAYVLATSGAGAIHLWPGQAWLARRAPPFFLSVMAVGSLLFARSYLDPEGAAPRLAAFLSSLSAVVAAFPLCLAVLPFRAVMPAADWVIAVGFAAVVAAAAMGAARRGKRSYFVLPSWAVLLAGFATSRLGPGPLERGVEAAALVQVLLMSLGISSTVDAMRRAKEEGQRRSIELLERANKVKEDFLIGTSLELRSPLYGIIGLLSRLEGLLAERAFPEERRLVSLVRAEATRLANSVENIASYARLRNDDLAFVAERFPLRDALDGAIGVAAHIAAGRDIAVDKRIEDAEVETDIRALQQIVYNLFSSALQRSPSGTIVVEAGIGGGEGRAAEEGEELRVAVTDSAPPLPPEVLERGLAASEPGGRESIGPGLELLVTRLLAERLGGSLEYRRVEGGGRFELRAPRFASWPFGLRDRGAPALPRSLRLGRGARPLEREPEADLSESAARPSARGMVLVVDEDPVFLEALKRSLEERGYAVAPTASMDRAVELVESGRRFDLALIDATGPGRRGLAACARIRRSRPLDELPVVLMTDRESASAVADAFRAGASDYMPKLAPQQLFFARVDTQAALRRAVEERLETRRRIAELEKLKTLGVLAAGVAHEINTPNNAVLRNLPIVAEVWKEISPIVRRVMEDSGGFSIRGWSAEELLAELPELVSDTYAAGLQIKKIVEDLKDYARDSQAEPPEDVDLAAVAAYAARLLGPLVARSTARFSLEAPAGLPTVRANHQKLTQVAVNVLENALQSLPGPDAAVRLSARADPGRGAVVLECVDEGRGMDAETLERAFEPFYTTKRESGGTGLGLSVALGIVRDAGGDIEIESAPGRGTAVRVVLPAAERAAGAGGEEETA